MATAALPARRKGIAASLIETTKPGITRLVTVTSMVGFIMACCANPQWSLSTLALKALIVMVGTALSASGANAINQYMERHRDARMPRTRRRPLPQARVTPAQVLAMGLLLCILGVLALLPLGLIPALVSLACVLSYLVVYTPLKPYTTLATFVGAIPGALPPLIGWTAGAGASFNAGYTALLNPAGWSLFALMFVWQIPHFLAIAWMYRDDYAAGGYKVLPVVDPAGSYTAATIALWTAALVPATLLPAWFMPRLLGLPYALLAVLTGVAFLFLAARLVWTRGRPEARAVFFGSIIHLPLLLLVMVGEAIFRALLNSGL